MPVFGACYADVREAARRASGGVGTLASFRLARSAETLERDLREHFLPEHTRSARLQDALDLGRLGLGDLVQLLRDVRTRFITDSYQRAEVINLAADFYVKGAVRALEKEGLDPAMYLGNTPRTVVHEAMEILARVQRDEADLSAFLKEFGHRSPLDYELAEPRYRETPQVALAMASRSTDTSTLLPAKEPAPPKKKVLRLAIDRARRFQSLKEEAKHAALRDVAFLRRVLLELGDRLELGEGVFQLALEELERLDQAGFRQREAVELVRLRQEEADALGGVELPTSLSISMLETLDVERGSVILAPRVAGDLRGTRISGSGEIVARARVLRHAHEIDGFQKGEILVARFTDPTWMPVFPLCAGLITEVGGWLSHAAIQAREYGITGIVGVEGALDTIQTGDLVRLTRAGQVERLPDRRRENRREMLRQVIVGRERESIQGRISDISGRGALLVVVGHKLEIGEEIAVQGLRELRPMQATVVRNGTPGHYGLLFRETYAA